MREFITLNTSKFPIVEGKYQGFIPTQEELVLAQVAIENLCVMYENFVLILNFSELPPLSFEYRIAQAKWAEKNDALFAKKKMKVAFYTPSMVTRVVMKSVFIISTPSIPYTLTPTLEKAYAWAFKQLGLKPDFEKFIPDR
jgi:hypothetical protein